MKNAKEMRAVALEVIRKEKEEKIENALNLIENKIAIEIENVANAGRFEYAIDTTEFQNVDWETVMNILDENGYRTKVTKKVMKIEWWY